jgi:alcohol dehydrogenase class IV
MGTFEFATANRIIFGAGKLSELASQIDAHVQRLLLVRGSSADAIPRVRQDLTARGIQLVEFEVRGEPTVAIIRAGVQAAQGCQMVIGLGGGSVMDAGKAIAVLASNDGDVLDYLEVVGRGQSLVNAPLPYIAIPTTAGTGTEVTRNAVIESPEHGVKVSLRSPLMLPRLALVDPELTYGLPPAVTASSGLDALTQLIEPFVSLKANPLTDAVCREGLAHAARSLRTAWRNGWDQQAREGMSLASLFGGMALANAALGAVHGFAGPLGGMLHAPHGAICARLIPLVMHANLRALRTRQPEHPAIDRYTQIARILTGKKTAAAQDGVDWVGDLVSELNTPALGMLGMDLSQIPEAVEKTLKASSFKGNPIALTAEELSLILEISI